MVTVLLSNRDVNILKETTSANRYASVNAIISKKDMFCPNSAYNILCKYILIYQKMQQENNQNFKLRK